MARVLIPLGIVLALLLGLAATAGVLAYGNAPTREGRMEVDGLDAPATVAWGDSGRVWIEAETEAGLAAGLGYAHGADHGWAAMLWRQAAHGTLSQWFGDSTRALDLHARALGLQSLARRTYEALPAEDRTVLEAYAAGMNRAFAEPGVAQGDAFVVTGVVPEPWRPWDALAVERLHAYLAAPALTRDSTWRAGRRDSVVAAFVQADSLFRGFLGMPGGGYDRAYVVGDGRGRGLGRQVSAGSSALPLFAPATIRLADREGVALTIPGTMASPAGWSGGLGWGLLLGSPLVLEPYDGPAPPPVYSRIVERDGDETLLAAARDTVALVLRPGADTPRVRRDTLAADTLAARPARATPSGWRVRWRGFQLGTDLAAFRALRSGRLPSALVLLDGAGLAATADDARVLGAPTVAARGTGYALVAQSTLARYAAARLDARARRADSLGTPAPDRLAEDAVSAWAAALLPDLLAGLGARDSLPDVLQTPYSYLRSWDAAYTPDGIAPSIFEWWLIAHREMTGHLPDPTDSLDVALLPYSLRVARAELRDRFGPLPSSWRWGALQGGPRYPVLGKRQTAAARRYRGPLGPPGGHPTALVPGPGLVLEDEAAGLAVWSVWTRLTDGVTTIRSPERRPPPSGVVEGLTVGPDLLTLTPGAPLPPDVLLLVPPS